MLQKRANLQFSVFLNSIVAILLIVGYLGCMLALSPLAYTFVNMIQFFLALFGTVTSLFSMQKNSFKMYNSFFLVNFLLITLNSYNITTLQYQKTIKHLYFIFAGVLVFGGIIYCAELLAKNKSINTQNLEIIDGNLIVVLFLAVYIGFYIFVFYRKGIPLLDRFYGINKTGDAYTIAGISGIIGILKWILLMSLPFLKKTLKIGVVMTTFLFSGILVFKRGDIVRIGFLLGIFFVFYLHDKLFTPKVFTIIIIIIIMGLVLFSFLGDLRERDPGGEFHINQISHSQVENAVINWTYTYTALNYDVLLLYPEIAPTNVPNASLAPVLRVLNMQDKYEEILVDQGKMVLPGSGFNASTMYSPFIADFGYLYIFELAIFALFIGYLAYFAIITNNLGVYAFLTVLGCLSIFGNLFTNPSYLYAILSALLAFTFIKKPKYIF